MKFFSFLHGFIGCVLLAHGASAMPVCIPTTRVAASNYPGAEALLNTNNLLLPTGKSIDAEGQRLVLQGRLLDEDCKPIPQAVVELWQVDPYGKYILATDEDVVTSRPEFAGAGRAVTDLEGNFTFTTAFPGIITYQVWEAYKVRVKDKIVTRKRQITIHRAPHLNLLVRANGFNNFSTALFFEGDQRNGADPVFKKLSPAEQRPIMLHVSQTGEDSLLATKNIVLSGEAPYRTY